MVQRSGAEFVVFMRWEGGGVIICFAIIRGGGGWDLSVGDGVTAIGM